MQGRKRFLELSREGDEWNLLYQLSSCDHVGQHIRHPLLRALRRQSEPSKMPRQMISFSAESTSKGTKKEQNSPKCAAIRTRVDSFGYAILTGNTEKHRMFV